MPDNIYSYADRSWPVVKGCRNDLPCAGKCWAARECNRLADNPNPKIADFHAGLTDAHGHWTGTVKLNEAHLTDPLKWRKPAVIATAYHGDLFLAPESDVLRVFTMMALARRHQFLLLTKRPENARKMFSRADFGRDVDELAMQWLDLHSDEWGYETGRWPLPNVWPGVSVTNQADADERIPLLLQTPAAHRWVSIEPCVGAVDLTSWLAPDLHGIFRDAEDHPVMPDDPRYQSLDWVVLGGESGPNARPMHPDWARKVRDDCQAAGVPYFHKQNGEWMPGSSSWMDYCDVTLRNSYDWPASRRTTLNGLEMYRVGKKAAGNLLDGCLHNEMPEGLSC